MQYNECAGSKVQQIDKSGSGGCGIGGGRAVGLCLRQDFPGRRGQGSGHFHFKRKTGQPVGAFDDHGNPALLQKPLDRGHLHLRIDTLKHSDRLQVESRRWVGLAFSAFQDSLRVFGLIGTNGHNHFGIQAGGQQLVTNLCGVEFGEIGRAHV